MVEFSVLHAYGDELERRLRLQTFPLALKLLEKEADIPNGAIRPKRDLGYHLLLCQAFQMSRRTGETVAMLKEDMWCFEPVVGYGLAEPPEYFLEGYNRFPRDVETLEAGRNYAMEFPRLEVGKYVGVVSAPLTTANFEPDVVTIYCNSAQLTILLLGREYKEGRNLTCALSGHAACVYAIVPALQNRTCQVGIPCRGDRRSAMATDDELIFTVPMERMADLVLGLRQIAETGSKLPTFFRVRPEVEMPESYQKIAGMVGMDVERMIKGFVDWTR